MVGSTQGRHDCSRAVVSVDGTTGTWPGRATCCSGRRGAPRALASTPLTTCGCPTDAHDDVRRGSSAYLIISFAVAVVTCGQPDPTPGTPTSRWATRRNMGRCSTPCSPPTADRRPPTAPCSPTSRAAPERTSSTLGPAPRHRCLNRAAANHSPTGQPHDSSSRGANVKHPSCRDFVTLLTMKGRGQWEHRTGLASDVDLNESGVQLTVISASLWGRVWVEVMFDGCRCALVERVSAPSLRGEVLGAGTSRQRAMGAGLPRRYTTK